MRTAYLASRLKSQLLWWGRGAVVVALALAGSALVGWASGRHQLTRVLGNWPPMTPWTAVLISALAVAILLQSGRPSGARVWVGRFLAMAVGVVEVVFLIEYATGRSFGLDQVWFPDAMSALQSRWPGRPSPRTSSAVLALSVAVGLMRVDRRGTSVVWVAGLMAAEAVSLVAIASYLFGALSVVVASPSRGVAISTALCVGLLVFAILSARPDRNPVSWLLARPDRAELVQLAGAIAVAPVLIAVVHGLLTLRGVSEEPAWMASVLTATAVVGTVVFAISDRSRRLRLESEAQFRSVVTNAPNAIAIRSLQHGYEFANQAFCGLY